MNSCRKMPTRLKTAALRLIDRAERQAAAGNPRLLEAITDALKPREHVLIVRLGR